MCTKWIIRTLRSRIIISEVRNSTTSNRAKTETPQRVDMDNGDRESRRRSNTGKVKSYQPLVMPRKVRALKIQTRWAKRNTLREKPDKTERNNVQNSYI